MTECFQKFPWKHALWECCKHKSVIVHTKYDRVYLGTMVKSYIAGKLYSWLEYMQAKWLPFLPPRNYTNGICYCTLKINKILILINIYMYYQGSGVYKLFCLTIFQVYGDLGWMHVKRNVENSMLAKYPVAYTLF